MRDFFIYTYIIQHKIDFGEIYFAINKASMFRPITFFSNGIGDVVRDV